MGLSTYEVFQQAKQRIAAKTHDFRDEVIVALWEKTAEALVRVSQTTKLLDAANVELRQYAYQAEILTSRLARFEPSEIPPVHQG